MKFGFGKKRSLADIEREAQAELEAAMSRARPPTDAERTWVLPPPEVPDLLAQSRLERAPRPARPARQAPARQAPEPADDLEEEGSPPPPARARKAAPAKKRAQPVSRLSKSRTKRAPTPRRSTDEDTGLA